MTTKKAYTSDQTDKPSNDKTITKEGRTLVSLCYCLNHTISTIRRQVNIIYFKILRFLKSKTEHTS